MHTYEPGNINDKYSVVFELGSVKRWLPQLENIDLGAARRWVNYLNGGIGSDIDELPKVYTENLK